MLDKEYNISKDPDHRGIGGASSGAIAAFTVAWERPDQFRKVLSIVGSFTNLRGGHVYPEMVRASREKAAPRLLSRRPQRQPRHARGGGQYNESRDWFLQNVRLVEAMTEKGYDVNYSWGIGLHGQKQGGAILPDMMRWLWREHPTDLDPREPVERSYRLAPQPTEAP